MNFRVILLPLLLLFLAIGTAPAQTAEELVDREMRELTEGLALTLEQEPLVRAALIAGLGRQVEIFRSYQGRNEQQMMAAIQADVAASQETTRSELAQVLDAGQLRSLEEYQDQKIAEVPGEIAVYRLRDRLQLSDEQAQTLVPILAHSAARARAAFMQAQETGGRGAMRSMRSEMEEIQEDLEDELKKVLTDDQLDEYKRYRDEQREKMREELKKRGQRG